MVQPGASWMVFAVALACLVATPAALAYSTATRGHRPESPIGDRTAAQIPPTRLPGQGTVPPTRGPSASGVPTREPSLTGSDAAVPIVPEADTVLLLVSTFALTGVVAWSQRRRGRPWRAKDPGLRDTG